MTVRLSSHDNREAKAQVPIDEFSSFDGALKVPGDWPAGVVRVTATLEDRPHQSEARVQEYVKPTFYLEVETEGETVQPSGTLQAKVRARRYAGGVPKSTRYEVFLYRSSLDAPTWVDDAGRGGQGSEVTYGSASTTEGQLSVPQRLYSSVAERMRRGEVDDDAWATAAAFDEKGEAEIEIPVPPLAPGDERIPYRYSLSVRARDDQGTFASGASTLFLSPTELLGAVATSAKIVKAGADASLSVRSTTLSGKPKAGIAGSVIFVLRRASGEEKELQRSDFKTQEGGGWRAAVPTKEIGQVLARVTLNAEKGEPWQGEASLLVAGDKNEPVARVAALTLESLGSWVEPGGEAELVALMPEGWGERGRDEGSVWLTLSGATLFGTQRLTLSGRTLVHRFPIEKRFGTVVYASVAYPSSSGRWEERTVPFRIVPSERTLSVAITPAQREVRPLAHQSIDLRVTDAKGRGVVSQLSVGVVDKAVYAVQSEFRPKVLEFFYPLGRNNVASFHSVEFQGYGYGEALARAFGRLPSHAFASVKPPTRQAKDQDRDTAFWTAKVVTDAEGRASVRFPMPSNQTLWVVTAVAADASGRFGEGTSEFASRGGPMLVTSAPLFLREGDEATGSVRVTPGANASRPLELSLGVTGAGALTAQSGSAAVRLEPKDERVVPFTLAAKSAGSGELTLAASGAEALLQERRRLVVRGGWIERPVQVSRWGGGELTLPPGAVQGDLELVLQPSIVEAALTNVRALLDYPYGCLEQLVSTTIPNLALHQVLERTGALARLDTSSQELLAEARSRAVMGTQRILNLAVKGGGFTWFGGYSEPSVPLTLVALDGLSYAVEAGLVERLDTRIVESARWLESQGGLPTEWEATRAYVLARLEGAKQAARVRSLILSGTLTDPYSIALAVLAAERARILEEPAMHAQITQLAARSRDAMFQPVALRTDSEAFWRYPLRPVGLTAILAHAASFGELDVAKTRQRVLDALSGPSLSTFDRGTLILHSLWLIERDAKAFKRMGPPKVTGPSKSTAFAPFGMGLKAVIPGDTRRLEVGSFDGVATLRATHRVPLDQVQAAENGMSITRRYFVLRSNGLTPISEGEGVAQGEEVFVELTIDAKDESRTRSAYYVVEDSVPAGFVALTEDKIYRAPPYALPLASESLKRRSVDAERVTFFFEEPAWWSRRAKTFGYVMRAQFPGRFWAPPARIEDMYAPMVRGNTAAATLSVRASEVK